MNIRGLLTEEDAISPVIAVVLMVALTVVLSAAVGAFVLDIGAQATQKNPNAVITYEFDVNGSGTETMTLTQQGGNPLDAERITVYVDGASAWEAGSEQGSFTESSTDWDDEIQGGDSLTLTAQASSNALQIGDVVQVIWQKGEQSAILSEQRVG